VQGLDCLNVALHNCYMVIRFLAAHSQNLLETERNGVINSKHADRDEITPRAQLALYDIRKKNMVDCGRKDGVGVRIHQSKFTLAIILRCPRNQEDVKGKQTVADSELR